MAFMGQALELIGFEDDFQMVQPWWDVLSEFAVDFAVMLALTSVTTDLFEGSGALACVAGSKDAAMDSEQGFVQQACQERWSYYIKYFAYVIFAQAVVFLLCQKAWINFDDGNLRQLSDFVRQAKRCRVRWQHVQQLNNVFEGKYSAKEEEPKSLVDLRRSTRERLTISQGRVIGLRERLTLDTCEEALLLIQKIGHFIHNTVEDSVCRNAYLAKCFLSLLLAVASLVRGCFLLADGQTFSFQFCCQLDRNKYSPVLRDYEYYCADKSVTFAKILQIMFTCVTVVIIVADLRALYAMGTFYRRYKAPVPRDSGPAIGLERDDGEEDSDGLKMRQLMVEENQSRQTAKRTRFLNRNFLYFLLREADVEMAERFSEFLDEEFRDQLEALIANLKWPLDNLEEQCLIKRNEEEAALKMIKTDLAYLPKALRALPAQIIDEADFSFSCRLQSLKNVEFLANLTRLKCQGCHLDTKGIEPITYLTRLEFLDLSRNNVEKLPREIGNLKSLRWLWIEFNLVEFEDTICDLDALVEVRVEAARAERLMKFEAFMFTETESRIFRRVEKGRAIEN